MTSVLIVSRHPAPQRTPYYHGLRAAFPEITVNLVDDVGKCWPYIQTADVLITFGPHMSDEAFAAATNLRWVQSLGSGIDALINRPTFPQNVILTNIHGIHATPVSEAALLSMLALSRHLPRSLHAQERREWDRDLPAARTLEGKSVGILGIGAIAAGLAPRCKALGMTVIGLTSVKREVPGFDRVHERNELLRVAPELDYLVLLTPYTKATEKIIDAAVFGAMRPTSYLVNLARGGVMDEEALVRALDKGQIAGAALDVFQTEPLPPDHPLWSMANVIITPHVAGSQDEYPKRALPVIVENLRRFMAGDYENMINVVRR